LAVDGLRIVVAVDGHEYSDHVPVTPLPVLSVTLYSPPYVEVLSAPAYSTVLDATTSWPRSSMVKPPITSFIVAVDALVGSAGVAYITYVVAQGTAMRVQAVALRCCWLLVLAEPRPPVRRHSPGSTLTVPGLAGGGQQRVDAVDRPHHARAVPPKGARMWRRRNRWMRVARHAHRRQEMRGGSTQRLAKRGNGSPTSRSAVVDTTHTLSVKKLSVEPNAP
jgi:hypothetical protein